MGGSGTRTRSFAKCTWSVEYSSSTTPGAARYSSKPPRRSALRAILFLLSLWLAAPAFANPLEGMLCETTPVAVTRMESSEKLCRSFALALAGVPGTMSEEVRAMLTPESLAAMMTLSAAWLGSQGVPVVGQAVDGALVVLGVVLLAAQSAELSQALWTYVNLATAARSRAELEAAAAHLSRAIALVGVNVVAFILTKKTAGSFKPGPPAPGLAPALASGGRVVSTASPSAGVSTTSLPAFAAMGARPEVHRELPGTGARKEPDPESFEAWIRQAPRARSRESHRPCASNQDMSATRSCSSAVEGRRSGPMATAPRTPCCGR